MLKGLTGWTSCFNLLQITGLPHRPLGLYQSTLLDGHHNLYSAYMFYSAPVGEQSIAISSFVCLCVSVCVRLSVCLSASISMEPLDRSSLNFVCRSLVLYRWLCDTLCTSVFMDYVTFGRNGPYGDGCDRYDTGAECDVYECLVLYT